MATEKNITMKQFNGTDYDTLYPKTIASQIPDVYSKSQTYPQSQLYTRSQIDSMINSINTVLDGKARTQTGSYVGTGTYGVSNPCSLTFDFVPKLFWVPANDSYNSDAKSIIITARYYAYDTDLGLLYITGTDKCGITGSQTMGYVNTFVLNGKTLKWYTDGNNGTYQYNKTNCTYYWIALG